MTSTSATAPRVAVANKTSRSTAKKRSRTKSPLLAWNFAALNPLRGGVPLIGLLMASCGVVQGLFTLATMGVEAYSLPALGLLSLGVILLAIHEYRTNSRLDPTCLVLLGLCMVAVSVVGGAPDYFGVLKPNGILHRSVLSGLFLLCLGVPIASTSLFYLYGGTPRAQDVARYPFIVAPVVLFLGLYAAIIGDLIVRAVQQLQAPDSVGWRVYFQPYSDPSIPPANLRQSGLLNQFLGTGLLVGLTTLISLPIGVGTGVFLSEFGHDWEKRVVSFAATALRGISPLLIALTGFFIVLAGNGQPWLQWVAGFYVDNGTLRTGRGSFVLVAVLLSLLVIPIIARATEQGCLSVPRGMREGSAALGASADYMLRRITLPWAMPNIVTSVLLGCAEAAGSVTVLLLIAGSGARGVGVFSEATSLAFSILYAQSSPSKPYRDSQYQYQFAAALALLVLALAITLVALLFKHRYAERYRGV